MSNNEKKNEINEINAEIEELENKALQQRDNADSLEDNSGNSENSDESLDSNSEDLKDASDSEGNKDSEDSQDAMDNKEFDFNKDDKLRNINNNKEPSEVDLKTKDATEVVDDVLEGQEDTSLNKVAKGANTIAEIGQKAANFVNKVAATSGFLFKIITSPITWITVLVIIVIMLISSGVSVLGGNDYNVLCGTDGVGVVSLSEDSDDFTRQSAIVAWLTSTRFFHFGNSPMNREQAIGVMGNFIQESYQANNKAFQGDHSMTKWQECDNECILDTYKKESNQGIGIAQWDGSRRQEYVEFAIEEKQPWHDLNTQLKFLKKELDGSKGLALKKGGFTESTNSLADYTRLWDEIFEMSDLKSTDKRIAYAEEFASKYTGGTGLAMNCIGGSGVDTSNLVQLAINSAWPWAEYKSSYGSCSTYTNCGSMFAMPSYITAKKIAEETTIVDNSPGLLASCDRYVATMYKATGKDPNFPWGNVASQMNYMESSPDWEKVSCQARQPGDVLAREGHIMLYLGMVNGVDSLGSASIARNLKNDTARSGAISGTYCVGDLFHADGSLAQGYRKVR